MQHGHSVGAKDRTGCADTCLVTVNRATVWWKSGKGEKLHKLAVVWTMSWVPIIKKGQSRRIQMIKKGHWWWVGLQYKRHCTGLGFNQEEIVQRSRAGEQTNTKLRIEASSAGGWWWASDSLRWPLLASQRPPETSLSRRIPRLSPVPVPLQLIVFFRPFHPAASLTRHSQDGRGGGRHWSRRSGGVFDINFLLRMLHKKQETFGVIMC